MGVEDVGRRGVGNLEEGGGGYKRMGREEVEDKGPKGDNESKKINMKII